MTHEHHYDLQESEKDAVAACLNLQHCYYPGGIKADKEITYCRKEMP
jgi:hypothetical protein